MIAVAFAGPAASIAFSAATEGYSTLRVIVAAVVLGLGVGVSLFAIVWLVRKVWVGRRSWLAPPTPIESYWDAYWAVRRGNPPT